MYNFQKNCQSIVGKKLSWRALITSSFVITGLATMLPATAVTTIPASYRNEYRFCAARLLALNISATAVSSACSTALNPRRLSTCVYDIQRRTNISAIDALPSCRQVRQPNELASCVVGISVNSQEETIPEVLDYCRRSLLPVKFAECVVGLRQEIDVPPTQAMDSCIDASDRSFPASLRQ